PPATFTTIDSAPSPSAAAIAAATSSSSVTSPPTATARSPSSTASSFARVPSRSNTATPTPRSTRWRTVAAPRPPAPPVTIAARPSSCMWSPRIPSGVPLTPDERNVTERRWPGGRPFHSAGSPGALQHAGEVRPERRLVERFGLRLHDRSQRALHHAPQRAVERRLRLPDRLRGQRSEPPREPGGDLDRGAGGHDPVGQSELERLRRRDPVPEQQELLGAEQAREQRPGERAAVRGDQAEHDVR